MALSLLHEPWILWDILWTQRSITCMNRGFCETYYGDKVLLLAWTLDIVRHTCTREMKLVWPTWTSSFEQSYMNDNSFPLRRSHVSVMVSEITDKFSNAGLLWPQIGLQKRCGLKSRTKLCMAPGCPDWMISWSRWHRDITMLSLLLALLDGNHVHSSPVDFPHKGPVIENFEWMFSLLLF